MKKKMLKRLYFKRFKFTFRKYVWYFSVHIMSRFNRDLASCDEDVRSLGSPEIKKRKCSTLDNFFEKRSFFFHIFDNFASIRKCFVVKPIWLKVLCWHLMIFGQPQSLRPIIFTERLKDFLQEFTFHLLFF